MPTTYFKKYALQAGGRERASQAAGNIAPPRVRIINSNNNSNNKKKRNGAFNQKMAAL